jgi:hypothetical protein
LTRLDCAKVPVLTADMAERGPPRVRLPGGLAVDGVTAMVLAAARHARW